MEPPKTGSSNNPDAAIEKRPNPSLNQYRTCKRHCRSNAILLEKTTSSSPQIQIYPTSRNPDLMCYVLCSILILTQIWLMTMMILSMMMLGEDNDGGCGERWCRYDEGGSKSIWRKTWKSFDGNWSWKINLWILIWGMMNIWRGERWRMLTILSFSLKKLWVLIYNSKHFIFLNCFLLFNWFFNLKMLIWWLVNGIFHVGIAT